MSKIGTEAIIGQIFKPIVTTLTYSELDTYKNNGESVNVNNAVIFSIPRNEDGTDNDKETSIWATDSNGLLCPMSIPWSMLNNLSELLENYNNSIINKQIDNVTWSKLQYTCEAGTAPNLPQLVITYKDGTTKLINVDSISLFIAINPKVAYDGPEPYYNFAGTYYVEGYKKDIEGYPHPTSVPLTLTINAIVKQNPFIETRTELHNDSYYINLYLSSNIAGTFDIISVSEGDINRTSCYVQGGNEALFKISNNSYETITPIVKYIFTPDNQKYYNNISETTIELETIDGMPVPHTYYWYAGAGPIDTTTIPGSDSNWHIISGTPTSIETGDQTNETKINWIIAVPTEFGLNHVSNGVLDITTGYDISIVLCGDGVEYKLYTQIRATKRTDVVIQQ